MTKYKVTLTAEEAALPFIRDRFADQPLIEAWLRITLGISYRNLREDRIASEQFEAARTLYTKHLGPDHQTCCEA